MNYLPLVIGVIETIILLGAFFYAASRNWGGKDAPDDECTTHRPEDTCFCETAGSWPNVKQRSNTWSNLAVVVAGFYILWRLSNSNASPMQNPMQSVNFYSVAFGALVIFLGPGSMYFHASLKKWGGWLDTFSMNLFISFISAYTLSRLVTGDELTAIVFFAIMYLTLNIAAGYFSWTRDGDGTTIFIIILAFTLAVEFLVTILPIFFSFPAFRIHRDPFWLGVSIVCFGAAFAIWSQSETGGRLCKDGNIFGWFSPKSLVQGHAVWHILNALAATAIFLYLQTETLR